MQKLKCCNYEFEGRRFELDPKNKLWRGLFFADCPVCWAAIAEIKEKNHKGIIKTILRRSGAAAVRLYEKHFDDFKKVDYKIQRGTKIKEQYHYLNKGVVYNLNDRVIAPHDKFLNIRPCFGAT